MRYHSRCGQIYPLVLQVYFLLLLLCYILFKLLDFFLTLLSPLGLIKSLDCSIDTSRRRRCLNFCESHRMLKFRHSFFSVLMGLSMLADLTQNCTDIENSAS